MSRHQHAQNHRNAAHHHEQAARHHYEASEHHMAGNRKHAAMHAHAAHGHAAHANDYATEASKSHAEEARGYRGNEGMQENNGSREKPGYESASEWGDDDMQGNGHGRRETMGSEEDDMSLRSMGANHKKQGRKGGRSAHHSH